MVCISARRSDEIFFHESPASVLRKSPVRAASQTSPLLSTATELMEKSASRVLVGSQLSPPLTETATALRPAIATTLPATLMLTGTPIPGSDSARQVAPESELTKSAVDVAANHLSEPNSRTVMRGASSLVAAARAGVFLSAAAACGFARGKSRGIHRDAFAGSA